MPFLGIISWKGVSCFSGWGGCFSDGASFFSGEGRPMGAASVLIGGFRKQIVGLGEEVHPHAHPTMGNPD